MLLILLEVEILICCKLHALCLFLQANWSIMRNVSTFLTKKHLNYEEKTILLLAVFLALTVLMTPAVSVQRIEKTEKQ